MTSQQADETGVPTDTFEMRLVIARFHAGNLSANEAAMRVGVSGQAWRNWEAGVSPGAKKPAMLSYIAEQLGVDAGWLRQGGPLKSSDAPGPDGPEGKSADLVRQQGFEPRTRWFAGSRLRLVRAA